jgi:hypothetical protein
MKIWRSRAVIRKLFNVILSPSPRPVDETCRRAQVVSLRSSRSGQAPRRISNFFVAEFILSLSRGKCIKIGYLLYTENPALAGFNHARCGVASP